MDNPYILPLSLVTFLPAIGALVLAFFPQDTKSAMQLVHAGHHGGGVPVDRLDGHAAAGRRDIAAVQIWAWSAMQDLFSVPWIPSFNIYYFMGIDGISFPLVVLTSFVCMLAMGASWNIEKHVKAYCILFLLLETGMLGVFLALDFFLFYVFWEVMLLPMYFLIGVWGGPRKEYAAIKFFLYTLRRQRADADRHFDAVLQQRSAIAQRQAVAGRRAWSIAALSAEQQDKPIAADSKIATDPQHTFNILALQQMGQHTESLFRRANRCWARRCNGGRSCCCSSASRSKCRPCRCTPGCPMRTSRRRRRSR